GVTFTIASPAVPSSYSGSALVLGDFNGDYILDLAYFDRSSKLVVVPGNENGDFRTDAPIFTELGTHYAGSLIPADLNADGLMDLAFFFQDYPTPHIGYGPPINLLELIETGHDGTFSVSPVIP